MVKATITIDSKTYNDFPTLIRNDYGFTTQFNVLEDDDTAFALTDKTVVFKTKKVGDSVTTVSSECSITSTSNGTVTYSWQSGDLSTSGVYYAELEISETSFVQTASLGKIFVQEDL